MIEFYNEVYLKERHKQLLHEAEKARLIEKTKSKISLTMIAKITLACLISNIKMFRRNLGKLQDELLKLQVRIEEMQMLRHPV